MGAASLVVDEIDAGAEFLWQFNQFRPVRAGFWMREAGDMFRYLFVALDEVTPAVRGNLSDEKERIIKEMREYYLDPNRVNIVSVDDRVAKAVLDLVRRYPGKVLTQPDGPYFGGVETDEMYIYPMPPRRPWRRPAE